MKLFRNVMLGLALLSFVGIAQAAQANKAAKGPKALNGTILKIDGTSITVKHPVKNADPKEVVVATDKDTKITLDGNEAKLADLKEGMRVKVTPATGTAKTIDAKTVKPRAKKNANK
jgi:hypothetical protein